MTTSSTPTLETCNAVAMVRSDFRKSVKPNYIVFDYMVTLADSFDLPEQLEMRGIAFDHSGKIVSRPYHKFFNLNEKPSTSADVIDFSQPHVILEKLDGSMIRTIEMPVGYVLGTRAGETDVSALATEWLKTHHNFDSYNEFIEIAIDAGMTAIFEFCSRKQRIVIDYPETQLVLTAIRNNQTGEYVKHDVLKYVGGLYDIPVVREFEVVPGTPFSEIQKQVAGLKDEEGVVIRFDSGFMVKMKAEDYVLKHRALDGLRFEKDVFYLAVLGELDDVLPMLPKDRGDQLRVYGDSVVSHLIGLEAFVRSTHDAIVRQYSPSTKKEYASIVMENFPNVSSLLFIIYDGKSDLHDTIKKLAVKACGSSTLLEEFKSKYSIKVDFYA